MLIVLWLLLLKGKDVKILNEQNLKIGLKNIFIIALFLSFMCFMPMTNAAPYERLIKTEKLIVAIPDVNHAIYFHRNERGELSGLDVDIAKDIAHELGLSLEFNQNSKTWDDAVNEVYQGRADVAICNLSITLQRSKKVLFSRPYERLNSSFLISRLWFSQHIRNESDLMASVQKGPIRLGVLKGSSYYFRIKGWHKPSVKILLYSDINSLFRALKENQLDAAINEDLLNKYFLLKNPKESLFYKVIVITDQPDLIAVAVSYQNHDLLEWINNYLLVKQIKYSANGLLEFVAEHPKW